MGAGSRQSRKKEDAADREGQGKGQLLLEHVSLINREKPWPGKTLVCPYFTKMSSILSPGL